MRLGLTDRIAILLSLLGVIAGYIVTVQVFEGLAHLEDEQAYVWQAQALTRGQLSVPSPPEPKSFLVPFVVDHNSLRFSKYPPGWPALLSLGILLDIRSLVNPLLGGLGIWLTYLLGKRVYGATVGLLAAGLTLTSPFFLLNSGSLLSHPLGLVLSAGFALAWLKVFSSPRSSRPWLYTMVAAFCLGWLALTRPWTAVAVGLPFGLHGLYLLVRGDQATRWRLLTLGATVFVCAGLLFAWQYVLTGDPLLNPYTLWWSYDRVGFGPGHGRIEGGHNLHQAWINTRHSLQVGNYDLFGWWGLSWIFLPFGLLATLLNRPKRGEALLLVSVFPTLLILYNAYWIGSSLFGPRYYYEGLYSLTLLSAAGIALLAGWPYQPDAVWSWSVGWRKARELTVVALTAGLVFSNSLLFLPNRLAFMHGLYGVERRHLQPFITAPAQELTPALVIVHTQKEWIEYGTLLDLENPFLDTPFIFVTSRGPATDAAVAEAFPDRHVYHYYQEEPNKLYTAPRPKK